MLGISHRKSSLQLLELRSLERKMTFGLENLGCRGDKVLGMSSVGVAVVLFVSFGVAASPWSRSIAAMFVVLYSVSLSLPL